MCIAIHKPADTTPDWDAYYNGYRYNNDSWGFAAVHDGALICRWGLGTFEEFRSEFEPYAQCQAIIHFRIATSGEIDLANSHPFFVDDDLAFIHNGVIDIQRELSEAMSDTWHFAEMVLKAGYERDPDFWLRPDVVYTNELAHHDSKFVFLHADGRFCIWNRRKGYAEADGHWYSNSTFRASASLLYSRSHSVSVEVVRASDGDKYDTYVEESSLADRLDDEQQARSDWYYDLDMREEQAHEQHCATQMMSDLISFGLSQETVNEIHEVLGNEGIANLHEVL